MSRTTNGPQFEQICIFDSVCGAHLWTDMHHWHCRWPNLADLRFLAYLGWLDWNMTFWVVLSSWPIPHIMCNPLVGFIWRAPMPNHSDWNCYIITDPRKSLDLLSFSQPLSFAGLSHKHPSSGFRSIWHSLKFRPRDSPTTSAIESAKSASQPSVRAAWGKHL